MVAMSCATHLSLLGWITDGLVLARETASETVAPDEWVRLRMDGCRCQEQDHNTDLAHLVRAVNGGVQARAIQRLKGRLQTDLNGEPIGWLFRQIVIGNGVPIELWAPGGVSGDAFAKLVDEVLASNPSSGRWYGAKLSPDVRLLESGESYHRELVELIDATKNFLNIQQYDWKVDRGGKRLLTG
jgi:hypothetical protein